MCVRVYELVVTVSSIPTKSPTQHKMHDLNWKLKLRVSKEHVIKVINQFVHAIWYFYTDILAYIKLCPFITQFLRMPFYNWNRTKWLLLNSGTLFLRILRVCINVGIEEFYP